MSEIKSQPQITCWVKEDDRPEDFVLVGGEVTFCKNCQEIIDLIRQENLHNQEMYKLCVLLHNLYGKRFSSIETSIHLLTALDHGTVDVHQGLVQLPADSGLTAKCAKAVGC